MRVWGWSGYKGGGGRLLSGLARWRYECDTSYLFSLHLQRRGRVGPGVCGTHVEGLMRCFMALWVFTGKKSTKRWSPLSKHGLSTPVVWCKPRCKHRPVQMSGVGTMCFFNPSSHYLVVSAKWLPALCCPATYSQA